MTQKTSKTKTSLLALALGSLVATSLSAGALTTAEEEATPKKFFANRFSAAKSAANAAKSAANAATKTVCTNRNLFRLPKLVLSNCIKNYPDEMKAFKDRLESIEFYKNQIKGFNEEKSKNPDKKRLKNLQKQLKEATAEQAKLSKQVAAIGQAAQKVVEDLEKEKILNEEKISTITEQLNKTAKKNKLKRIKKIKKLQEKNEQLDAQIRAIKKIGAIKNPENEAESTPSSAPEEQESVPAPKADIPPPPGDAPDLMHMKKKPIENETANPAANSADIPAPPPGEAPKPGSATPKPQDSGRGDLLADIRQGHKGRLKKVESQ